MQGTGCRSTETLERFAIGAMPGPDVEELARHVAGCVACQEAIEGALPRVAGDDLVRGLRELAGAPDPAEAHAWPDVAHPLDPGLALARRLAGGPFLLGRFEVRAVLGRGTFGHVFRAHDMQLGREVALKVPRRPVPEGSMEEARLLREARGAARLDHPAIVTIHEVAREDGVLVLVEELVVGETLAARLRAGPLALRDAATTVRVLADALHHAHECGVVHRDVKPSNVILDADGRPRMIDFGLARIEEEGDETGAVLGTPAYMSPEQVRGDTASIDARSDVHALGVVLYELLTGERPFQGTGRLHRLQVLEDDPRPPRQLDDAIPRDLETIALKAMARSRAGRYATARALAEDLGRWLEGRPILARPISAAGRTMRWCLRNPLAASLLAALAVGSVAGLIVLSRLSRDLMEDRAVEEARLRLQMLETFNDAYAEVVDRVDPTLVDGTDGLGAPAGPLPLPARLTIDVCARLSSTDPSGATYRLYSNEPFPWRTDGGPRDAFERDALQRLGAAPDRPVVAFGEADGRPVIRYAAARRMKASCVACHNTHPQSPRTDWREGDVRGALLVTSALDREIARADRNLRGAFVLYAASAVGMLALVVGGLLLGRRRQDGR